MQQYLMQWSKGLSPTWEYRFEQPSNDMAVMYARRLAAVNLPAGARMFLWKMPEQQLVIDYEIQFAFAPVERTK